MRLIVSSNEDIASRNILEKLLDFGWDEFGEWRGNPLYRRGDDRIATVNRHHIYADGIDKELTEILGEIDHIVFISKHSSKAEIHSLTVHPIGNFGEAKFGGKDHELVPTVPHQMTTALLDLYEKAVHKDILDEYEVSFEATHHGPYLQTPAYYVEIGSVKGCWEDDTAGEVIASTLMERKVSVKTYPKALCIGGGHYAPKFTDIARRNDVYIGHIIPSWALKDLDKKLFEIALEQSQADMVIMMDDIPKSLDLDIRDWCTDGDPEIFKVSDFE